MDTVKTTSDMLSHMATCAIAKPNDVLIWASYAGDATSSPLPTPKPVVWQPEYHANYELAFLYEGECAMFVKGNVFRLTPGTFCLIPHGEVHYEAPLAADHPYHLVWFSVRSHSVYVFSSIYGAPSRPHRVNPGTVVVPPQRAKSVLDSLYWELTYRTGRGNTEASRYLAAFIHALAEAMPTTSSMKPATTKLSGRAVPVVRGVGNDASGEASRNEATVNGDADPVLDTVTHPVRKAYTYIENHYAEPSISIDTIAAHVALSPDYLAAQFKQFTGIAPYQFIIHKRMHTARDLLATTDVSVTDIARQLGYESPYHFSRMFRRFQGTSPTQFRLNSRVNRPSR